MINEEPLILTQAAIGLYLLALADTCGSFPQKTRALLLRGLELRLARLILRAQEVDGNDATSLRQPHDIFRGGLEQADARRKESAP